MSIQLLAVTASNFKSFKTLSFNIKEGVYHIYGDNQDDQYSSSNGAGKTSVLDAIYWCLTGDTLQGAQSSDDVVNVLVNRNCSVKVHLLSNDIGYYITRYRKDQLHGNGVVIQSEDLTDLSSHRLVDNQRRVREIIGVDFYMLKSILMLDSRMSGSFTSMTNIERLNFLESVRDYSIWDTARNKASSELNSLNKQESDLSLEIERIRSRVATNKKMVLSMKEELNSISLTDIEKEVNQIELELKPMIEESSRLSALISGYENKSSHLNRLILEQHSAMVTSNNQHKSLQFSYESILKDIEQCEKELSVAESLYSGVCPTCGQPVSNCEDNSRIALLSSNREELKNRALEIRSSVDSAESEYNQIYEQYQASLLENGNITLPLRKIRQEKSLLDSRISSLSKRLSEGKERIAGVDSIKTSYEERISSLQESIHSDISLLMSKVEKREEVRKNAEYVAFWKEAWGAKGSFRPMLLKNDIQYINSCLENYSKRLFSETSIQLSIPDKDNRRIEILVNNRTTGAKNIQMLSGGERRRLDLVIQLSILSLYMSATSFSCNVLFVDEVFDSLDSEGIYRVLSLLQDIGMSSIYVISHNEEIKSYIPNHIKVTKRNGISVLS